MYIDAPSDDNYQPMPRELSILAGFMAGFALLFFVYPAPLIDLSNIAAAALLNGAGTDVVTGLISRP